MSIYKCPKGHESTESDYCSECGVKINGSPQLTLTTNPPIEQAVISCPDCTAPHEPDSGNFCEICGYNFVTGGHGEVPMISIAPTPVTETIKKTATDDSTSARTAKQTAVALEVVVTIDPSLYEAGSPPPPTNQPPITFQLDQPTSLIGRRSNARAIYPEIPLDFDDAVSHRHALITRQPDGTFILRDIGSSNGTKLNGVELTAMVDTPIKAGDELTLGHWTRIIVKAADLQEEQP